MRSILIISPILLFINTSTSLRIDCDAGKCRRYPSTNGTNPRRVSYRTDILKIPVLDSISDHSTVPDMTERRRRIFHRVGIKNTRHQRQPGFCGKRSKTGGSYKFQEPECCNDRLKNFIETGSRLIRNKPKLGDVVKRIQDIAQRFFGISIEVFMSKSNFAVNTYYNGTVTCKLHLGDYYLAAYATPKKYNISDTRAEEFFSTLDAQEPLGGQRGLHFRALPNIHLPTIGHRARPGPVPRPRGPFPGVSFRRPHAQGVRLSQDKYIPARSGSAPFTDIGLPEDLQQILPDVTGSTAENEGNSRDNFGALNNTGPHDSIEENVVASVKLGNRDVSRNRFPSDTHCDANRRTGNKCCNLKLYETMHDAVTELSTSPEFGSRVVGVVAELIKKRVQQRFEQVFEVVVSQSDFALASHAFGSKFCKYEENGLTLLAYETPIQGQYDPSYTQLENYFSSISLNEPLGSIDTSLPNQRTFFSDLALEPSDSYRSGFPLGSFCSEAKLGSNCCNLELFQSMNAAYNNLRSQANFNPYDKRKISQVLRDAGEDVLGHSLETFVSTSDFARATCRETYNHCKYKVDKYYVLAYETPVAYPLHTDYYADNGEADPTNCPEGLNYLDGGQTCCDGRLKYEIGRQVDDLRGGGGFNKYDPESIARRLARSVQGDYNTRFETIVSRSDFAWSTNRYNNRTCKLAAGGYHALTFQSSSQPPLPGEFAEPVIVPPVQAAPPPPPVPAEFLGAPQPFPPPQPPPPPPPQFAPPQPPPPPPPQFAPPQFAPPQAVPNFAPPFVPAGGGSTGTGAGGGGGGGACFSTDTWLTTPQGKKRMDELQVGDYVLTANTTDTYFAPVTLWMHREPDAYEVFTTIITEYGKALRLTARHLIFRNKCDDWYDDYVDTLPVNSEAVFAEELEKGDCMFLLYKGRFRQQRLAEIYPTRRQGIYSPLTSNGRIFVNDMLASCYSDVKAITLQTTYFSAISSMRQQLEALIGSITNSVIELPFFTSFSKELLRIVVPYTR